MNSFHVLQNFGFITSIYSIGVTPMLPTDEMMFNQRNNRRNIFHIHYNFISIDAVDRLNQFENITNNIV